MNDDPAEDALRNGCSPCQQSCCCGDMCIGRPTQQIVIPTTHVGAQNTGSLRRPCDNRLPQAEVPREPDPVRAQRQQIVQPDTSWSRLTWAVPSTCHGRERAAWRRPDLNGELHTKGGAVIKKNLRVRPGQTGEWTECLTAFDLVVDHFA